MALRNMWRRSGTQVLVFNKTAPLVINKAISVVLLDIKSSGYTLTDSTLTILPHSYGLAGSMSTPQNICMCTLPLLSISIRPSSDCPVYGLEEHQRHLPSGGEHRRIALRMRFGENAYGFPLPVLSMAVAHGSARARCRQKLSRYFCMKSNSVNGNVAVISDIFELHVQIFEELPPNKPVMGPSGLF